MENNLLKIKIKERLDDWLVESTSHGLPNVHRNFMKRNWIICIMWFMVFLSGTAYCMVTVVQCFIAYYAYPVTISISKINELPATFPAVTICNVNPFNRKYALDFIQQSVPGANCFSLLNNRTINKTAFNECFPSNVSANSAFSNFIKELEREVASKNLNDSELMYYGYQLGRDMLVSCSFNGETCTENNFTWSWSNIYGNCYTFNKGNDTTALIQTSATGDLYGLFLELAVAPPNQKLVYAFKAGIYLAVHNQSELLYTLPPGIGVQTGIRTYVGVNREFTNKLNDPYSDCITDSDLNTKNSYAKTLFGYFRDLKVSFYKQSFCFTMCFQDKLIDQCNCQDIRTPIIRNSTYCVKTVDVHCFNEFDTFFSKSDLNQLCSNACPQKCNSIEYNIETSSKFKFPTLSYLHFLQASDQSISSRFPVNVSDDILTGWADESFLKVVVNYDNLYHTSFDESPAVSPNAMFGLVGGQMGLFLGISILSLVEIVEIILDSLLIYCKTRISKKYDISQNVAQSLEDVTVNNITVTL